jgi:hypothetical protein
MAAMVQNAWDSSASEATATREKEGSILPARGRENRVTGNEGFRGGWKKCNVNLASVSF